MRQSNEIAKVNYYRDIKTLSTVESSFLILLCLEKSALVSFCPE